MNLELSTHQAATLQETLTSYLSEMHTEISHTDNREFREMLKEKRREFEALMSQLQERLVEEQVS